MGSVPGSGEPLGLEMATHSSVLAWKIPWTEEPGGLQSVGSQRVRHNYVTEHGFLDPATCVAFEPLHVVLILIH